MGKSNIWFFMAFSPYVFSQIGHFQMLFFWPLIFSLYFFFSPKKEMKHHVLIGFLLGLQFLSSVYVGIMGLFMFVLHFTVQGLFHLKRENLIQIFKRIYSHHCYIFLSFLFRQFMAISPCNSCTIHSMNKDSM